MLGLVGYVAKGLKAAAVPIDFDLMTMGALPLIMALPRFCPRTKNQSVGEAKPPPHPLDSFSFPYFNDTTLDAEATIAPSW